MCSPMLHVVIHNFYVNGGRLTQEDLMMNYCGLSKREGGI
jgi:hypothetical protein